MSFSQFTVFWLPFVLGHIHHLSEAAVDSFDAKFIVRYGNDHVSKINDGVQLSLDQTSGAGFISNKNYISGSFQVFIKLPAKRSPGVVSTFYLTSQGGKESGGNHDEIDFEFLGTDGPPFTLQTNIFANDNGGREQRIKLWFDPSKDFHRYEIIWNHQNIIFYVDKKPIRVYKNNERLGGKYPKGPMFIDASIWNGDTWASGGRKIDWSKAPFQLQYRGFNIQGCEFGRKCNSKTLWWNTSEYWNLTQDEDVKKNNLVYDYCLDEGKSYKHVECHQ